jgi:hypothetical protein
MAVVKKLYEKEGGPNAETIVDLCWDYLDKNSHFDALKVSKRLNCVLLKDTIIEDKVKKPKPSLKKASVFRYLVIFRTTLQLVPATGCTAAALELMVKIKWPSGARMTRLLSPRVPRRKYWNLSVISWSATFRIDSSRPWLIKKKGNIPSL